MHYEALRDGLPIATGVIKDACRFPKPRLRWINDHSPPETGVPAPR
jgi:hypothetical protein